MKNKNTVIYSIAGLLLALPLMFLVSCGSDSDKRVYAPVGSTIGINPATTGAISMPTGTLRLDVTVSVEDDSVPNPKPLNGISVYISAGFAYPFDPPLYHMYDTKSNALLSSPFIAETGDYGTYQFYLLIPATISWPTPSTLNSFTNTVYVTSGFATPAALDIDFN